MNLYIPEYELDALQSLFEKLPVTLQKHFGDAFDHIGNRFYKVLRNDRLKGDPGIKSYGRYGIASRLQRVIHTPDEGQISNMGTSMTMDSAIAGVHEEGGELKAKDGKLLIPVSKSEDMYQSSGKLKTKFKAYRMKKKLENDQKRKKRKYFFQKINGKDFLIMKIPDQRKLSSKNPMWRVVSKVKMKKRLHYFKTFNKGMGAFTRILNNAVSNALNQDFKK